MDSFGFHLLLPHISAALLRTAAVTSASECQPNHRTDFLDCPFLAHPITYSVLSPTTATVPAAADDRSQYTCRADITSPPRNVTRPLRLAAPCSISVAPASANTGKGGGGGAKADALPETCVNESAISSLALGDEEDFGGRNASANVLAGLEQEGDGEDVEGDDGDGRTQRLSKGAGPSSSSERGARKSAKSDPKDREKKTKKREVRDEEAARLKRAAEWLEKLAPPEPERELVVSDAEVKQDTSSPSLPQNPAPTTAPAPEPTAIGCHTKPNPRSSGFATLRRALITLPAPESAPTAPSNVPSAARRVANRYQAPP
ncbi:hypothetical protein EDB86DRAFT_3106042 [Lactarius hatsudake]|nr:hypothetical protein EDB86DRAFT_3106042 [Lactarius hatsudake]